MNKYKINFIYEERSETSINEIFVKALKKDIRKYINNICKKSKRELTSTHTYLSIKEKEDKIS